MDTEIEPPSSQIYEAIHAAVETRPTTPPVIEDTLVYKDVTFKQRIFNRRLHLPPSYKSGWFQDVLEHQLRFYDERSCDSILRDWENVDWDTVVLDVPRFGGFIGNPTLYGRFFRETRDIVFVLDQLGPQWLERMISIAKRMFAANHIYFMRSYHSFIGDIAIGTLLQKGHTLTYCSCPVNNLLLCVTMRVVADRFPFRCIEVYPGNIERLEEQICRLSLEEHANIMSADQEPPYLMARVMRFGEERRAKDAKM